MVVISGRYLVVLEREKRIRVETGINLNERSNQERTQQTACTTSFRDNEIKCTDKK